MEAIKILAEIFVFVLGLCIGSFLNVAIYRLEQEKHITGRSFCPHCKKTLKWHDMFPVLSFVFLGGKCRQCKGKISWQYPLVEIGTAIIFLLIFNFNFLNILDLIFLFYIASVLTVIFVYDLKHYLIPDKVLFPAIMVSGVYRIFENMLFFHSSEKLVLFWNYVWAAVIASGFFFVIFALSKGRAMGFGDVKLAILMGLLLGVENVLLALFLAFFFGAIISLILLAFYGKNIKSEVPFGPFLIAGTLVALFWGESVIGWYFNFFRL